jgi:hypothetical protein
MFIPRVPTATAALPAPSATRLREHGRLQRLLRRAAGNIADRLPGFRGRLNADHMIDAADAVGTRAGRRHRLKNSPHLGHIVDIYV